VRLLGIMDQPVGALRIFRDQMRPEQLARRTVFLYLKSADHVQAQMGQVRQILRRKAFAVQMRVDQAQPLEAGGRRAKSIQAGDEDASVIAQDHHADFAFAVNQQADLPVERTGQQ